MPTTVALMVTAITNAGASQTPLQLATSLGCKMAEVGTTGDAGVRAGSLVKLTFPYPNPVKYGLPGAAS